MKKSIKEVAKDLKTLTWIPYQYFEVGSLLLLNISTSPDSIQEYAAYKKNPETGDYVKFESLTISWMKEEQLVKNLEQYESAPFEALTHNNCWSNPKNTRVNIPIITPSNFVRFQKEFHKFEMAY